MPIVRAYLLSTISLGLAGCSLLFDPQSTSDLDGAPTDDAASVPDGQPTGDGSAVVTCPAELRVDFAGPDSLKLLWEPVDGSSSYEVVRDQGAPQTVVTTCHQDAIETRTVQ